MRQSLEKSEIFPGRFARQIDKFSPTDASIVVLDLSIFLCLYEHYNILFGDCNLFFGECWGNLVISDKLLVEAPRILS